MKTPKPQQPRLWQAEDLPLFSQSAPAPAKPDQEFAPAIVKPQMQGKLI